MPTKHGKFFYATGETFAATLDRSMKKDAVENSKNKLKSKASGIDNKTKELFLKHFLVFLWEQNIYIGKKKDIKQMINNKDVAALIKKFTEAV